MKYLPFLLLTFCFSFAQAQDISGFWKGSLTMPNGCFIENNIEIQIQASGDSLVGDSYHYLDINNYVKKNFKGSYSKQDKKVIIQEGIVTTYKIRSTCTICIKRYELTYSRSGNVETLSGGWTGKIQSTGKDCETGNIVLTRIKESAFKEIPEVKVDTGTIRLDFYDNGIVDGDIISVIVNGNTVLSHQELSAKPITTYLKIDLHNTFQEIEMFAENEGSIPPNTALLIVTANDKRYRLFLSSRKEKSAKVRFVYEPKNL
jgi:hypothetical protein